MIVRYLNFKICVEQVDMRNFKGFDHISCINRSAINRDPGTQCYLVHVIWFMDDSRDLKTEIIINLTKIQIKVKPPGQRHWTLFVLLENHPDVYFNPCFLNPREVTYCSGNRGCWLLLLSVIGSQVVFQLLFICWSRDVLTHRRCND